MFEEFEVFSIVQCIADGPIVNAVNGKSYSHIYMCPVYVSHSWLFPKYVTVIHHGGAGTVSSAIVAGVPQVCYYQHVILILIFIMLTFCVMLAVVHACKDSTLHYNH